MVVNNFKSRKVGPFSTCKILVEKGANDVFFKNLEKRDFLRVFNKFFKGVVLITC